MSKSPTETPASNFSNLRWAEIAAFIGCAACCAIPLLAAAGLSGGAVATLSTIFRPGHELIVGVAVFAAVIGVMALRKRVSRGVGCGSACKVDGSCCDRGSVTRKA